MQLMQITSHDVHKYVVGTNQSQNHFHNALQGLWSHMTHVHSCWTALCDWHRQYAITPMSNSFGSGQSDCRQSFIVVVVVYILIVAWCHLLSFPTWEYRFPELKKA